MKTIMSYLPFVAIALIALLFPEHLAAAGLAAGLLTTLAMNSPRAYEEGDYNSHPMIANDIIYEGAALGDNGAGYARPLVAGDKFLGFAAKKADNTGGAAGAIRVLVRDEGKAELALATVAITDVGADVYASDDDTFTLTVGANSKIGVVSRYVDATTAVVSFAARGAEAAGDVVNTADIADSAVTLTKLAAGVTPSHVAKFAGSITWSGSGATLATTIAGLAATDRVVASIRTAPTQAAYLVSAAPTTNTLTLTLSAANTGNDAVIDYVVFRAAA